MRALLTFALALALLAGIVGLTSVAVLAPWWCLPFSAALGFGFGGMWMDWLGEVWAKV